MYSERDPNVRVRCRDAIELLDGSAWVSFGEIVVWMEDRQGFASRYGRIEPYRPNQIAPDRVAGVGAWREGGAWARIAANGVRRLAWRQEPGPAWVLATKIVLETKA